MSSTNDHCLRAMTDDGGFRVMTARTTDTVRAIAAAQRIDGDLARWLGDLVTGTILVRETMSPGYRVQGILHGRERSGSMVADAHPDGGTRGLVQRRGDAALLVGAGAILEMSRTLPRGTVQRGVVEVPDGGSVSTALMAYMQESEQVISMVAVATLVEGAEVRAAGGYLVQLLPELSEPMLAIMTERLGDFATIESLVRDESFTPASLMEELLYGMPHTTLADSELSYRCRCNAVRLLASLSTLPRADIEEMVNDAKPLEIECDYCHTEYVIDPEQLRGLLTAS